MADKWQQCYDEGTGCAYYWNTETNQVTWDTPREVLLYNARLCGSTLREQTASRSKPEIRPLPERSLPNTNRASGKKRERKHNRKDSGSEDDVIELISSYGEESESDDDEAVVKVESVRRAELPKPSKSLLFPSVAVPIGPAMIYHINPEPPRPVNFNSNPPQAFNVIKTVQKPVETVPVKSEKNSGDVTKNAAQVDTLNPDAFDKLLTEIESEITKKPAKNKIALVAGYGSDHDTDSDDGDYDLSHLTDKKTVQTNEPVKEGDTNVEKLKKPNPYLSHPHDPHALNVVEPDKTLMRKRRFDFDVFPNKRRYARNDFSHILDGSSEDVLDTSVHTRMGFGYSDGSDKSMHDENLESKCSVKKSINFVKAETIFESVVETEKKPCDDDGDDKIGAIGVEKYDDFNGLMEVVKEKVTFLVDASTSVSPAQAMLIQFETLVDAYKLNALKESYLYRWLKTTDTDLMKLEQDAAPLGWSCKWDRSAKRYVYENKTSGSTQWEYPIDIKNEAINVTKKHDEDAMDISTTPPPTDVFSGPPLPPEYPVVVAPVPPLPPVISVPKTPPPPTISFVKETEETVNVEPPPPGMETPQPLPPLPTISESEEKELAERRLNDPPDDSLGTELESFYSEISSFDVLEEKNVDDGVISTDPTVPNSEVDASDAKKKKRKTKITGTLAYKKKDVSSLVEKWKKVQMEK